jgi:hypothetical protein
LRFEVLCLSKAIGRTILTAAATKMIIFRTTPVLGVAGVLLAKASGIAVLSIV